MIHAPASFMAATSIHHPPRGRVREVLIPSLAKRIRPIAARAGVRWAVALLLASAVIGIGGCKRNPQPAQPASSDAAMPHGVAVHPAPPASLHVAAERPQKSELPETKVLDKDTVPDALKRGNEALQAKLFDNGPDSALAQFRSVIQLEPDNQAARSGMDMVYMALLGRAQAKLLAGDVADAQRAVDRLQQMAPNDPAVAALAPRLAKAWKVDGLLARASKLEVGGHPIPPEQPNAAAVYLQALAVDPDSSLAEARLEAIENRYIAPAVGAAEAGRFPEADRLIALAARVRQNSQPLQDATARIVALRQRRASELRAQADAALATGDADRAEALLPEIDRAAPLSDEAVDLRKRIDLTRSYGVLRPRQSFTDGLDSGGRAPEMIVIPIGSFRMGSTAAETGHDPSEEPVRTIAFKRGFALSLSEVTVAQFGQFISATHYQTDAKKSGSSLIYDETKGKLDPRNGVTWRDDSAGNKALPEQPVIHVSWNDAAAYAAWIARESGHAYRLPTEAEFEYALRAGSEGTYPWGNGSPHKSAANVTGSDDISPGGRRWGNAFANYGDGFWGPAPVMHFRANAFGVYDIDGNVSEWVADCWHESYRRAPADASAWMNPGCPKHVARGASWASSPEQARSAYRQPADSNQSNARIGFRLLREL